MNSEIFKRIISSIILLPFVFFCIIKGSFYFNSVLLIVLFITFYEWHKLSKNKTYYFYGFIFLITSLYYVYKLRVDFDNSYNYFLLITLICIFTDLGGYIFGKIFKGPKLTKYSPGKTFSGLFGSFFLALFALPVCIFLGYYNNLISLKLIIFIIIISLTSQMGDLIISFFKRKSNIKDTGNLIPGHGGLLDRIDGMLFAYPISYLLLTNYFDI